MTNFKESTVRNYRCLISKLLNNFGKIELISITTDGILLFLKEISEGNKQSTKRLRYSLFSAFFNFIKDAIKPELRNPCDSPMLRARAKITFLALRFKLGLVKFIYIHADTIHW